jgi:hypothetical protein
MESEKSPKKPAWFDLVDSDALSAQVRKVDKRLPALAAIVTGAVIASGAFFAAASESDAQAGGNSATVALSQSSQPATATAPVHKVLARTTATSTPSIGKVTPTPGIGGEREDRKSHEGSERSDGKDGHEDHDQEEDD